MNKIPMVVVVAFLFSAPLLAADGGLVSDTFQYTLATDHEDEFGGADPNAWVGKYGQFENEDAATEEITLDDSADRRRGVMGTGIGLEVASLFGTYGVYRTSIKDDASTYVALGVLVDELNMDETGTLEGRNDSGLSYGFGVNSASYNIEYMVYMDEVNYGVSAISLGFSSEF